MPLVQSVAAFRRLCFSDPTPEFAHALVMKRLGRAHENVIAAVLGIETKRRRHLFEVANDVIGLLLRCAVVPCGRARDVYAMLVSAGKEERLNSLLTLAARNRVSHDHRIEMAEMRE